MAEEQRNNAHCPGPLLFVRSGPRIRAALAERRRKAGEVPPQPIGAERKRLLSRSEAARYLGYSGATAAFDHYCTRLGVAPLPGRRGVYDKLALDDAIDRIGRLAASDDYKSIDYG